MRVAAPLAALAVLALGPAAALAEGPAKLELAVGERVNVCAARLAACPLQSSLCDDAGIAAVELGKAGAEIRGVSAGTTLCGLLGAGGLRRVVRVTVTAAPPAGAQGTKTER
jgi:hypothetical protein